MLVQVVGEAPLRRETRTTEANKQRDFLSTPGSSSQEEADGPTPSHSSKRKRLEQDRGSTKKRKVCETWGPNSSSAVWLRGRFPVLPVRLTLGWDFSRNGVSQWLRAIQSPVPPFHSSDWPDTLKPSYITDTSLALYHLLSAWPSSVTLTVDTHSTFLLSLVTFNHCMVQEPKVDHHTSLA